jgi:hypothetical protein
MDTNDRGVDVILNDDDIYDEAFLRYLADYRREYGAEFYRNVENTPFSILVSVNGQLNDLYELWTRNNDAVYFLTLLDNDNDLIAFLYERTPRGVEGFRYVLGFLFMYNITRIHKIVERDAQGVIYSETPNEIFRNIDSYRVVNTGPATNHERELVNIINDEARRLYPDGNIPENMHPFDGNARNNFDYFNLINGNFNLFLNRVTLRYYKQVVRHRQR